MRSGLRALSARGLSTFSRDTALLLLALALLNGSNYVFHVVVSRQLGPSEYGALAALLAVLLVLSVPQAVPESAELLGYLPREELYERMARAHCPVVLSVREGWGSS